MCFIWSISIRVFILVKTLQFSYIVHLQNFWNFKGFNCIFILYFFMSKTKDEFQLAHNVDILVAPSGSYFRHELKASESYTGFCILQGPSI